MIDVEEVKNFIRNSSLHKFRAKCIDGTDRVILLKQKEKIYSAKTLLSEYLIGRLAHEFGINAPDVSLIKMNNNLYNSLGAKRKLFDLTCNIGVASDYIELDLPNPNEFYDFLKNNKIYSNQIYGMKLFMCWIYLNVMYYSLINKENYISWILIWLLKTEVNLIIMGVMMIYGANLKIIINIKLNRF